jgi:hypothetical protein
MTARVAAVIFLLVPAGMIAQTLSVGVVGGGSFTVSDASHDSAWRRPSLIARSISWMRFEQLRRLCRSRGACGVSVQWAHLAEERRVKLPRGFGFICMNE